MKKKFIWLVLSLSIVAALVLASCAPAAVEEKGPQEVIGEVEEGEAPAVTPEEEEEEKEEEAAVEAGPKYGGTLTWIAPTTREPKSWDVTTGYWSQFYWLNMYQSAMIKGDIDKYGPRGSNQFAFNTIEEIPEEYCVGDIAESWEVTPTKLTFNLRRGADAAWWVGNDNIGMSPRPFTAYDAAFTHNRWKDGPIGPMYYANFSKIYAEDEYTFIIEMSRYDPIWPANVGFAYNIYPPEVVENPDDIHEWQNQVASGPFILTDYVKGTSLTFIRNPTWHISTTIDGVLYDDIPFVDRVSMPLIPDESTRLAALRTAKVDYWPRVPYRYKETLAKTSPELQVHKFLTGGAYAVWFKSDEEPFNNKDVRRAMMIGTDREDIGQTVFTEYETHIAFLHGSPIYTPIEELPPSTKLLFEYNPDLAVEMLADAGYPNGFDMEMIIDAGEPDNADIGALLISQWAKIGVTLTLVPLESTAHSALKVGGETGIDYNHSFMAGDAWGAVGMIDLKTTSPENVARWQDTYYDGAYDEAAVIVDSAERAKAFNALAIYWIDEASSMQLPAPFVLAYWWPWVKNYYGETDIALLDYSWQIGELWIDQDLKKELGY